MDKSKQSFRKSKQSFRKSEQSFRKSEQSFRKSEQSFRKSKQSFRKSEQSFRKSKQSFRKSEQSFRKSKRSFRRRLPPIRSEDRIDYRNMSLISRFISEQGKILSRRVNRLTLKQQRLITIAIKQARILSLVPFLNKEIQFKKKIKNKKSKSIPRTRTTHPRKKKIDILLN